jgi:methyltransferase family protein
VDLRAAKLAVRDAVGGPRREHFLRLLPKRAIGAELGVFRGHFAAHLLRIAQPRELHLIDGWWELYGERFPEWANNRSTRDTYAEARRMVDRWRKNTDCAFHIGDDLTILERFPDQYFDWVYLDTTHQYGQTRRELAVLDRKVKRTGLIAGHDWQEDPDHKYHGVCRAAREFTELSGWRLRLVDSFDQWYLAR